MRKGVVDVAVYQNSSDEFLVGQVAVLGGSYLLALIVFLIGALRLFNMANYGYNFKVASFNDSLYRRGDSRIFFSLQRPEGH